MTDSPPPDDEIVSARLDGVASPDEATAVDASAAGRARLARFDAVRALVGEPVTPPPGTRDAAVAAALDVFDREIAEPEDAEPAETAPVVAVDHRRWTRTSVTILGAVASLLLLFGVFRVLTGGGGSSTADSTAAAPEAQVGVGSGGSANNDSGAPAMSGDSESRTSGAAGGVPDLGAITDAASLRRAVARAETQAAARLSPTSPGTAVAVAPFAGGSVACEKALRDATRGLGPVQLVGNARYGGAPATVVVFRSDPQPLAFVVDPASCRVLLSGPV